MSAVTGLKYKILSKVRKDLEEIERALTENLNPNLEIVSQVAGHILFNGGKRLRPLLMVLCARICNYKGRNVKKYSTIFEYLHTATLLHDDLVDGAAIRRGKESAHTLWDASTAVLVGDFLLARALSIAAETGLPKVIGVIAEITENMSQGEIHQLNRKRDLQLTENEYLDVIRCKTAVLFQGACRISGLISSISAEKERALSDYGLSLGMAFQMVDDLLDYTADAKVIGKPAGADLKEGKLTLPVIYALQGADQTDRNQIEAVIADSEFSNEDFFQLVCLLVKYGGIDYTKRMAEQYIERAKQSLSVFEPSDGREILLDVADYALQRTF
jgi:octaprenyl-diphosphate synthase